VLASDHKFIVSPFLHLTNLRMDSIFLEFNSFINLSCFGLWQLSGTSDFLDQLCDVFFVVLVVCNLLYQFFIARFVFICLFNFLGRSIDYDWTILLDFCKLFCIFTLFHHFLYFLRLFFIITYVWIVGFWLLESWFNLFFGQLFFFYFFRIFWLSFLGNFRFCLDFWLKFLFNFGFSFSLNFFFTLLLNLCSFLNFFLQWFFLI